MLTGDMIMGLGPRWISFFGVQMNTNCLSIPLSKPDDNIMWVVSIHKKNLQSLESTISKEHGFHPDFLKLIDQSG
jgi:hypothetical protein